MYISEKQQEQFDEIAEISKLCGIKYVSREDKRTPLSHVTHFIFHDLVSINRRRDLIPIANRSNKSIVSFEWLKDTYIAGTVQDESKYDLSLTLDVPAICPSPPSEAVMILQGKSIFISSTVCPTVKAVATELGADLVDNHLCGHAHIVVSLTATCECETVSESWIRECANQKRLVAIQDFIVRMDDGLAGIDQPEEACLDLRVDFGQDGIALLAGDLTAIDAEIESIPNFQ